MIAKRLFSALLRRLPSGLQLRSQVSSRLTVAAFQHIRLGRTPLLLYL